MNTNFQNLIKTSFKTLVFAGLSVSAYGQKLANIQEKSLWAPEGVKIDGKVAEWSNVKGFGKVQGEIGDLNDAFQALNKTTNLYYTMANDDKNLYLVVKAASTQNNFKIMMGGITLAVNTAGKKKEKEGYQVTFPVRNPPAGGGPRPGNVTVINGAPSGGMVAGGAMRTVRVDVAGGPGGGGMQAPDSARMAEMRKQQLANMKDIKVFGFKGITDSLISVYNEYGIKVVANYDAKGLLMYEMAIPLELMGLAVNNAKEFAYNIKLNGMSFGPMGGFSMAGGPPPGGGGGEVRVVSFSSAGGGMMSHGGSNSMEDMMSATDFWGKYTLAKKE